MADDNESSNTTRTSSAQRTTMSLQELLRSGRSNNTTTSTLNRPGIHLFRPPTNRLTSSSTNSTSFSSTNTLSQVADIQRRIALIRERNASRIESGTEVLSLDDELRLEAQSYIHGLTERSMNDLFFDASEARDSIDIEDDEEEEYLQASEDFFGEELVSDYSGERNRALPNWPGLIGTRSLNNVNPGQPDPYHRLSITRPVRSSTTNSKSIKPSFTSPVIDELTDPHTSSAPSSFLQPGAVFTGKQFYVPAVSKKSRSRSLSPPPSRNRPTTTTTSTTTTDEDISSAITSSTPSRLALLVALEASDRPSLALVQGTPRDISTLSITEMEEQILAYQTETQVLRNQSERYQEAHRITMDYLRGISEREEKAIGGNVIRDEKWEVKIIIDSYNHATQTITGIMQAENVPLCPKVVSTFFIGKILNPSTGNLWYEWERAELAWWEQIGPFKKSSKEEMFIRRKDIKWIEKMMEGWQFLFLQETEFINVTPSESKLSISGRYIVALERTSGIMEGVYHDPESVPTQRISLSACRPNSGFNLSTYSYA